VTSIFNRRGESAGQQMDAREYFSSIPRRVVTVYVPIAIFVFVLLFPFYWMALSSVKPDAELVNLEGHNPWWVQTPTLDHYRHLLFETEFPSWMWNTMVVAISSTALAMVASILAAYAIARIQFTGSRWIGGMIFLAYLVPPSILFIPLAIIVFEYGLFDSPFALIVTYPTILIPFSTWLLIGYFKTIPYELEECALIDGASRLQILLKIVLPLSIPGVISAAIFSFTLCWNEFIYALTFISSSESKTVPVAAISDLVYGDNYPWGELMAGALLGSIPVAIIYSFFVNHYVSSLTGAVKE
jgi:multiple sugar transport system permease protein